MYEKIGGHHCDFKVLDAGMPSVDLRDFHKQMLGDRPIQASLPQIGKVQMFLRSQAASAYNRAVCAKKSLAVTKPDQRTKVMPKSASML
jgi:hypothetical protein